MKPQDILVVLMLLSIRKDEWTQAQIADSLMISKAEMSQIFARLRTCGFLDLSKTHLQKLAIREFLIHGLKYVFPAKPGTKVRGIATAFSAPPIQKHITGNGDIYVWKSAKGNRRGIEIKPLYKTVPKIVNHLPGLYELLVITDTLRIGKVREVEIAISELDKILSNVG